MVIGMINGIIMKKIRNWLSRNACTQSFALIEAPHTEANMAGTSDVPLPSGTEDLVKLSIINGRAVKNSGRKTTVKNTRRFLKTSAHSLLIIVRMCFIYGSLRLAVLNGLQVNVFERMAQLADELNIRAG